MTATTNAAETGISAASQSSPATNGEHDSTGGYASGVDVYRGLGWRGVLPLKPGTKWPPPSIKCPDRRAQRQCRQGCECVHYTGRQAVEPSYPDLMAWSEQFVDGNLCLRLPDGVIGVDVDAYKAQTGASTLVEAVRRWGPLPAAPRSSSREGDLTSGIRLFRVPLGTVLRDRIEFPDLDIGDIEICQPHHRYVVCWPSVHPEGGQYRWLDETGGQVGIPAVDDLPWLPQSWLDGLRAEPRHNGAELPAGTAVDVHAALTGGDASPVVSARLREAIADCSGGSRHDSIRDHVLPLLRLGTQGEPGVAGALIELRAEFVAAVGPDRGFDEATREFNALVAGDRVPALLAVPSNTQWLDDMWRHHAAARGAAAQAASAAAESGDDWLDPRVEERMDRLRVDREARRRLDAEERPQAAPPPVKSLDALLAEPDSPTRYRIESVMPEGSRVLLSAQYKAGKSTTVGNLARALVDREPFLGAFAVNAPVHGLVLIDNELGENTLRRWLADQRIRNTAAVADVIALRGKVGTFDLLDDRRRAQWARRLADVGCDALVLDCLRPVLDAFGLDESHDAGKFLVAFDALLDEAGVTNAAVVHHMGHSGERARGDSRLQDWPDAIWRIVRESDEPNSARYFSAFGRDVDVTEGRLTFDPATRRLGYVGESRGDARTEAAYVAVLKLLAESGGDGLSGRRVEESVVDSGHTRNAVRAALSLGVHRGAVSVVAGPNRSKLHRIADPCAGCGLPLTGQRERHESCPATADGGDE